MAECSHNWSSGICTKCGYECKHNWEYATYISLKTCTICGKTEGKHCFGEETKEYTLVITGDLNGDGKIGNGDLIKLVRARVELETLGEAYEKAGDLNNEGKIGDGDIMMLARVLVGLIKL